MKRKLSVGTVVAFAVIFVVAVALAAAQQGMLDTAGRRLPSFVPEDAEAYVQVQNVSFENEIVSATVRESYYDGRSLRLTIDVTPKGENTLLIHRWDDLDQPWQSLINLNFDDIDKSDTRTVKEMCKNYSKVYRISTSIVDVNPGDISSSETQEIYVFNPETNVQTIIFQTTTDCEVPARDVRVELTCNEVSRQIYIESNNATLTSPVMSFAFSDGTPTYVSTSPVVLTNAGVQVDCLKVEVKPLELITTVEYTYLNSDSDNHARQFFRYVNPETSGETLQELHNGFSTYLRITNNKGEQHIQQDFLGRDELRDSYTLVLWNLDKQGIVDTCTIPVQLVESK